MTFGFPKPLKGTATLQRRQRRAELTAHERKAMQAAKTRDHGKCRWPNCDFQKKQIRIEGAHFLEHRGSGGNPDGSRTRRDLICSLCIVHHALLDRHELKIEPLTDANADGPLAFYVRAENGQFEHLASERYLGVPETRT